MGNREKYHLVMLLAFMVTTMISVTISWMAIYNQDNGIVCRMTIMSIVSIAAAIYSAIKFINE